MELLHLHYFCKIVECGGMTNASKELFVSQPSLSRVLSSMEAELGVSLFQRANRKLVPTAEGRYFYDKAKEALLILDDASAKLRDLSLVKQPKLSIAILVNQPVMEELIREYRKEFPQVELEIVRNNLKYPMEENDTDLYLAAAPFGCTNIDFTDIYRQEAMLFVSAESKFADREAVRLSELKSEPFVLPKEGPFRYFIESLCQYAGFIPQCIVENNNEAVTVQIIKTENCVGFFGGGFLDDDKIRMLRILEPSPMRQIRLAWRKNRYLSAAARQFIEFIQRCVQERNLEQI